MATSRKEQEVDRNEDDEGVSNIQKASQKEESKGIVYDINPLKATCPQCYVEITTFVRHEMNPFFPISAVLTMTIFGYLCIVICPLVYLLT